MAIPVEKLQAQNAELMNKREKKRMLKIVVAYCIAFQTALFVAVIIIACTIVPENDRSDLLAKVMYYSTWMFGGELLISAFVKLLGDKLTLSDSRKSLTKS